MMKKIVNIFTLSLIAIFMSSCGSDKYHISIKSEGNDIKKSTENIGWSSSGGNTKGFIGFGKSQEGSIKIKGIADVVEESENIEDVIGKKFDCEVKLDDVEELTGVKCTITGFEKTDGGSHTDMFGQEYTMKGNLEGEFNGEAIKEGSFSIKTYKKSE